MNVKKRLICAALGATLVTQLSACGTLFYPDRRGQIEGRIDPAIAVANAIGILFYVIPGLLAFAIDFATGAIYLPDGQTAQIDPEQLKPLIGHDGQVDQLALKQLIQEQTGVQLPLDNPQLIQQRGNSQQLAAYGLLSAA